MVRFEYFSEIFDGILPVSKGRTFFKFSKLSKFYSDKHGKLVETRSVGSISDASDSVEIPDDGE